MATVSRTRQLPAPPAEVWKVLSDFAAISSWAPNVDHSCLLSEQTEGVGTTRRIQTGRATIVETATAWEPDASLAYEITGLPRVIRSVTNTWTLEASGDASVATLTTVIDAGPRPPQKAIARAVGRTLGSASDEMLSGLAEYLDRKVTAS